MELATIASVVGVGELSVAVWLAYIVKTAAICAFDGCAVASVMFIGNSKKEDHLRVSVQWPLAIALGHVTFAGLAWGLMFLTSQGWMRTWDISPTQMAFWTGLLPIVPFCWLGILLLGSIREGSGESFGDRVPQKFWGMYVLALAFSIDAIAWGIALFGFLNQYPPSWHVAGIGLAGAVLMLATGVVSVLFLSTRARAAIQSKLGTQITGALGCGLLLYFFHHILSEAFPGSTIVWLGLAAIVGFILLTSWLLERAPRAEDLFGKRAGDLLSGALYVLILAPSFVLTLAFVTSITWGFGPAGSLVLSLVVATLFCIAVLHWLLPRVDWLHRRNISNQLLGGSELPQDSPILVVLPSNKDDDPATAPLAHCTHPDPSGTRRRQHATIRLSVLGEPDCSHAACCSLAETTSCPAKRLSALPGVRA